MFNLADYEPVEVRLEKFIKDYPDFRIATELEVVEATRYIVKAYLFKAKEDSVAWATGYAEETVSTRGVNQTSALENCETSAIGRALANAGYAPKGKRPSREEMTKVVKQAEVKPAPQDIKEGDVDYWTTPVGQHQKTVQAPVTLEKAMENIAAVLGTGEASDSPSCEHGHMKWREGDKNGKAWGGFFCTTPSQTGGRPVCPTLWYVLSPSGQWEPQKPRG
ncbi:hypothetical protein UFOVP1495_15 [uncultured Caudovirales phage]|uniref:Uncharacterized protein n=1 Tax=uncultured Caudovirales phage TaxID=2100421 RepID=A0A6J5RQX7_9CAUD|nr:hypothetical protein UFOVP1135_17 [uncultured Caudovirales phage]CAB4194204.1 hypothetical protein UFOVP1253_10 [uncultured Caudovirales phage]CAB4217198.1 hypothetical protein UFOVP1495_15 [uncultured Caudovirales phage]